MPTLTSWQLLTTLVNMGLHMQSQTKKKKQLGITCSSLCDWRPQMLNTDNGKEFVNELLTNWLEKRNIKHILRGKYHPQSQAAVESFNKTIKKFLNEAYTNSMFNGDEEWSLPLMVNDFLHYYNSKRVHSITKMISREILFNFKRKSIVEQVIMNTENSRKAFL